MFGGEIVKKNFPLKKILDLENFWSKTESKRRSKTKLDYLEDADIILKSDHLPLKKFLQKNTLNSKVNNWAVEISPYRIKFEYIKGIKNTLADTMSRLIQIDPEASTRTRRL